MMLAWKMAACLAAGNTVILKPAEVGNMEREREREWEGGRERRRERGGGGGGKREKMVSEKT